MICQTGFRSFASPPAKCTTQVSFLCYESHIPVKTLALVLNLFQCCLEPGKRVLFFQSTCKPILLVKHDCPNVYSAVHSILELCSRLVSSCSPPFLPPHSYS